MNVWHLFDSPKRPFLCSDLSKESSSVDRYQLRNIYCYIFLQLDNAMIYILYRKSWLKWVCRVYTWSTFEASVSPQKSARLAKNQQTSLKTLSCVLCKNTEKYRYLIFKNPGIGIWVKSRYTGIFRYTAGACSWGVAWLYLINSQSAKGRVADVEGAQERRSTKGQGLLRKEGPQHTLFCHKTLYCRDLRAFWKAFTGLWTKAILLSTFNESYLAFV